MKPGRRRTSRRREPPERTPGDSLDRSGGHTYGLEELSDAVRYRRYIFELLTPHLTGTILEVGAGHGDFAALFGPDQDLVVTDADPACVERLRRRFAGSVRIQVTRFDLLAPGEIPEVDSAVAINVLEHVEDDVQALRSIANRVRPGGSIVLFVPGYQSLYGPFDRLIGHVRRYSPRTLRDAVTAAGLTPEVVRPVNFLGGIAWWLAVRLGKRTRPHGKIVSIYDWLLVPLVRWMERRWTPPFGQSVHCVARRS